MVIIANWGGKGQEDLIKTFTAKQKEPWMTQDSISTYGDIWILKEAMETAKSADPKKVAEAMRTMEGSSAAKYFPGGKLKFEPNGRRAGAELVILQWQAGEPKPVYPTSLATSQAAWPKK